MLNDILAGAALFADPLSIGALVVGVIVGLVIGAIPGMSTVMGVSIMLPLTFTLGPTAGIFLLLGVYKGGMYGGSISAILINTPGTPAASCTMLDGYPMAKQGRARPALEMALYASCFGDMLSNIVLIISAGWLASFALDFGAPELFTLIVFALTIMAGVAAEQMVKGFIAMVVGLALATVGMDLITGAPRFAFDVTELRGGLSLVPMIIGLFALPEVFLNYTNDKSKSEATAQLGQGKLSARSFFSKWRLLLRSSFIGVILGAIPGLGATPAAFLSYGEARRNAKDPESFGKGNIDGVAASEAANSSVGGAAMVPLLALGIPGDVITAVILGAFMINGLQPGPLFFQSNIDIIYALFMAMIAGSLILLVVGKASIPVLTRVLNIRSSLLLPAVLILCVFGTYAINKSLFDVLVMFVIGVFGLVMVLCNFSRVPLLIGFVLGPLLENNFRQSILMSQGDWRIFFESPITWVFWSLTLLYFVMEFTGRARRKKAREAGR